MESFNGETHEAQTSRSRETLEREAIAWVADEYRKRAVTKVEVLSRGY